MKRLFLDSSVLFSAAYSSRGHSRDMVLAALRGEVTLVVSELVLAETRRNIAAKAPEHLLYLDLVIESVSFEFVRPTKRQLLTAANHVALKDAPIVAAAKRAKVDLLVTLDKKHLLGKPDLAQYVGAEIVTPRQALEKLREQG